MKVVLLGEIKGKGGEGDIVDVAQGYAENYLFPKKLAVAATKGNLKQLEERRNNIEKREAVRLADATALKETLDGKQVTVDVKVGDEGVLFGSVTAAMIADAIKEQLGTEIDRKRVELGKPIKVAGAHEVTISLYRDIRTTVVVLVGVKPEELVSEDAEAEVAEEEAAAEAEAAQPSAKPSLFIVTAQGRVLRFAESSVRLQGRSARGVLSITLWPGDSIVGLGSDTHGGQLLLVSERGMGTRLRLSEFNYKGRRARGVWGMRVTPKTGPVAAALVVDPHGQLMVSTLQGVTLRTSVQGVSLRHRGNSGVKFINVAEEDRVIGVAPVVTKDLQLEELPETEPQAESVTALQAQGAAQLSEADEDQEREVESEDYTDFYENLPTDSTEEDLKEEED